MKNMMLAALCGVAMLSASVFGQPSTNCPLPTTVYERLPFGSVKVRGAIGERIDLTVTNNLMKLNLSDDFIRPFAERSGKVSFVGTGNLLEALVDLAKYSGDAAVRARKDELVDKLLAVQEPSGYLGLMPLGRRYWEAWDLEDVGFILDGLVADWREFGSARSLEAAKRAADDVLANWGRGFPANWDRRVYDKELMMGLGHGVYSVYAATGDRRYLDFVAETRGYLTNDAPVVVGRDYGLLAQADGYLDVCYTQLEMYLKDRDPRLLRQTRRAFAHLFADDGALITGATGVAECWSGDQDGCGLSGETCFAAEAIVVYDLAIRTGAFDAARLGSAMERTLYNALFAAQSPDGRRLRYYTPFTGERLYWPSDVYCCPGNFRRTVGILPGCLFYANRAGVLANLYTAAEAEMTVGGVRLRIAEETDYPHTGKVVFTLSPEKPAAFDFALRIPDWCSRPSVRVNGTAVADVRPNAVCTMSRTWSPGDRVELDLPMDFRLVKGRCRQKGRVAVMRGPLVYSLDTRQLAPAVEGKTWPELKAFPTAAEVIEHYLILDPRSLRLAADGCAAEATVSVSPYELGFKGPPCSDPVQVTLKPFADPAGTLTYFRVPDVCGTGVDDALMTGGGE